MLKCLTSFAFGPQEPLLDIALPTFHRYAREHDYDLYIPRHNAMQRFEQIDGRCVSWFKVLVLSSLLDSYDVVLWLDADVAVLRHDRDILDDADDRPQHMVVHETEDGSVPNCGVWLVRKQAKFFLDELWSHDGFRRSSSWWEQAAVIHCLGGDPDAQHDVGVPDGPLWGRLPYEWNPHVKDRRGIPEDARFFHATMFQDRAAEMRRRIG